MKLIDKKCRLERGTIVQGVGDRGKTIADGILRAHDVTLTDSVSQQDCDAASTMPLDTPTKLTDSGGRQECDASRLLHIKFDKLTSHDITYVGIIQTARASGLTRFPVPYVLTNCHNSLCSVGGTINEDDHLFGLSAAKRFGGVYVPPHLAVIHQYAREMLTRCGDMILGSDSHTRYGALGTMAVGEGGPELVKQLLGQTYDIAQPEIIAVYLTGEPIPGVGPQDVVLALISSVFDSGFVKNKVLEFIGPGVSHLSADFRIGIDVMTTETTCLSSIWQTDDTIREFYDIHGRPEDYAELAPGDGAGYDGAVEIDLGQIRPMIALPFHPSNAYTIRELYENLTDILHETEERARVSLGADTKYTLLDKVHDGKLYVDQGIIAGCAGGGYENICTAARILSGADIGSDAFSLSVYPASMPIQMELVRNGDYAKLMEAGAVMKTAFCGPCFGAGDTPANGALSIRHSTRNFPNREGSKPGDGQCAGVALMDARSIAATAANHGVLTAADEYIDQIGQRSILTRSILTEPVSQYHFDSAIYSHRVYDSHGVADATVELIEGPNIKPWPAMPALPDNLLLQVVSVITDPVTTTDELIPSGETSSLRSNPEKLSEYTLSRKDPEYVSRAKYIREAEREREGGYRPCHVVPELHDTMGLIRTQFPGANHDNTGFGSLIYARKPGDGSAREQAASCQKVLGGWANIANEYATKRYRSNLINWGMLPFIINTAAPNLELRGSEEENKCEEWRVESGVSADSSAGLRGNEEKNECEEWRVESGVDGERLPFGLLDFIFIPDIRSIVENGGSDVSAYAIHDGRIIEFALTLGELSKEEREIILAGCLINYNRPREDAIA